MTRRSNKITKASSAFQLIQNDIINGYFSSGEKLPMEALKEKYDLGYSPLREALSRLVSHGLVEFEEQCGFSVSPLSIQDFEDLYLLRSHIEVLATSLAIERGDQQWEEDVLAQWHHFSKYTDPKITPKIDLDLWQSKQKSFLLSLFKGCQTQLIIKIWTMLYDQAARYRALCLQNTFHEKAWRKTYLQEKEALMKAMFLKDKEKSLKLVKKNLDQTMKATRTFLKNQIKE